ncbi:hypothetical protein C4D60_Mb04t14400 [Musa balbisiana]|uniref:Uncharacterized protein n=1 Tax=Musa balbisiana TaxID=52838 RepID=A0A4S8KC03_MUSBA|nr:hypothetical protein C4D60_Mb04t14400 [Musa balbisiana]
MEDNRNGVTDPRCIGVSVIVSASVNNIGHNEMKKEQRQKVSADSRINSKTFVPPCQQAPKLLIC